MKILKNEKGSITLFVLLAMLFFTMYIVGMYILSTNTESSQIAETARIKEIYEQGVNNIDDVYNTLERKNKIEINAPNVSNIAKKTYVTWNLNEEGTEYVINDEQVTEPVDWYDYEIGKWANIKTTNQISDTETLEAYWVWIPRYEYIVPTSGIATEIEVKFIPTTKTQADEGYIIHPAFTNEGNGGFGELDGIWVAKFEASSNTTTPDENYGGGNDTNLKVQVKPNVQSWRNIQTKNMFKVCRKMTNKGEVLEDSRVDSHMMKNTEWGAVAILSQSKYGIYNSQSSTGINGDKSYQVWNNLNGKDLGKYIKTGYVGINISATTSLEEYNKINGTKASTTGTVYGIYDMAGGAWEYVAGCLNGQENLKFGVIEGNSKYVDLYTNSNDSYLNQDIAKIGDATKETKNWNDDYVHFVYSAGPVFQRGGVYSGGISSGIFAFYGHPSDIDIYNSFRVVLVP